MVNTTLLINAYPDFDMKKVKIKWSRNQTSNMYKEGYRYCSMCGFMIKIKEYHCRICRKKFRFKPKTTSNIYGLYAESIYEPITINLRGVK